MKDELAICKGELGFTSFVARPYFELLAKCFSGNDDMNFISAVDDNIATWKGEIERIQKGNSCTEGGLI